MKTPTQLARRADKAWVLAAIRRIEADFQRSSDTHLIPLPLAGFPGVDLYLKDESSHPTGSLKHRLARSLFLYALCNGWLREGSTVVEASSGSTAVSEAYFSRLVGLPFLAVMPASTSREKITAIEFQGGRCHLIDDPMSIYNEAQRMADKLGGHYMDQFTYAERATDWRSNNNIAESIFEQMRLEKYPVPSWLVSSAGTGGTVATLGRYVRYRARPTRVCAADAEFSVFFRALSQARPGAAFVRRLANRGYWPATRRGVLLARGDRRHGQGAGRVVSGGNVRVVGASRTWCRPFDGDQSDCRAGVHGRDARQQRKRLGGDPAL